MNLFIHAFTHAHNEKFSFKISRKITHNRSQRSLHPINTYCQIETNTLIKNNAQKNIQNYRKKVTKIIKKVKEKSKHINDDDIDNDDDDDCSITYSHDHRRERHSRNCYCCFSRAKSSTQSELIRLKSWMRRKTFRNSSRIQLSIDKSRVKNTFMIRMRASIAFALSCFHWKRFSTNVLEITD